MRLLFLGNDPWSVAPLEALADDPAFEVLAVITNPPRPAGRGSALRPTAVADAAHRLGIEALEIPGVRDGAGADRILSAGADVLIVVAYGQILPRALLEAAPHGAVNLHFSLLPRWRGASPVRHALLAGDTETGVSLMLMDEGLDTGPVIASRRETIRDDDDAGALGSRLAALGAVLLVESLPGYLSGALVPQPQPAGGATTASKLTKEEREVVWMMPAEALARQVRAFAPDPGAIARFKGTPLKILGAAVEPALDGDPAEPGTVVGMDERGPLIAAGTGALRLLRVAPAGRKRMAAADWARGARVRPGDRFDSQTEGHDGRPA